MVQALRRAVRSHGCANCRAQLLKNFTSIAGVQWPAHLSPHSFTARQERKKQFNSISARYNHTESPARSDISSSYASSEDAQSSIEAAAREAEAELSELEKSEASSEADSILDEQDLDQIDDRTLTEEYSALYDKATSSQPTTTSSAAADSTPWYLQVAPEIPSATSPAALARQKLPELPENPPPILQPLLEQVSITLGIDDLTLLDLRGLDPPPALGANLLMIIGTARSEKHLHVSADRLCRWLRTNFKLRPDADGLLGRNELKLRLKRKAKKQRLVGMSPNSADDADDGVRTGWVCVNVGEVEGAEVPISSEAEDTKFVGFGKRSEGTKIVVQMLVDEKREELDLERLWGGIAKRQTKGVMLELDDNGNWQGQGPTKVVGEQEEFGSKFGEVQDGEFPDEEVRKVVMSEGNAFRKIST